MRAHTPGPHDLGMALPWIASDQHGDEIAAPFLHMASERYLSWREDASAVAGAYARWLAAPRDERARRFAAYGAALDQEATSAATYATALSDCALWLDWPATR
jgi:hypothetical protein